MIEMKATFKDSIVSNLEIGKSGDYQAVLTQEERKAMAESFTTESVSTGMSISTVHAVEKSAALQAAYTEDATQVVDDTAIFADHQEVSCLPEANADKTITVPVAACKMANIATGNITEDMVAYKAYNEMVITSDIAKEIKDEVKSQEQPELFEAPMSSDSVKDSITKQSSIQDSEISTTFIQGSMVFRNEINAFNQACINFRTGMLVKYYATMTDASEEELLAALRAANRSYIDKVFDDIYALHFGKIDEGDIAAIMAKNEAKQIFLANLSSIGAPTISDSHIKIGLNIRRMSIAPKAKWTTVKKVKTNKAGYCFVTDNMTSGIIKVPTTAEIIKENSVAINSIFTYGAKLLEKETRAENGLEHDKITLPTAPKFGPVNMKMWNALGISESKYNSLKTRLDQEVRQLAKDVCSHKEDRESRDAINTIIG